MKWSPPSSDNSKDPFAKNECDNGHRGKEFPKKVGYLHQLPNLIMHQRHQTITNSFHHLLPLRNIMMIRLRQILKKSHPAKNTDHDPTSSNPRKMSPPCLENKHEHKEMPPKQALAPPSPTYPFHGPAPSSHHQAQRPSMITC